MRHVRRQVFICGQRCFPLAISLIFVSFNLQCFQSKRITASSADKYMPMKFCIRSVLNLRQISLRQINLLQLCKFVYNFTNKFAIYLDKFIANLSRYEVFRMTKFTKIYASLYNSFKRWGGILEWRSFQFLVQGVRIVFLRKGVKKFLEAWSEYRIFNFDKLLNFRVDNYEYSSVICFKNFR